MSKDLVRHAGSRATARERQREQQQLSRELRDAQQPAKLAAARIQAAAFAAHTGLVCTEVLTTLEVQAVLRQGAVLDARAKAIVDTYCGLVTTEIARLSLEG